MGDIPPNYVTGLHNQVDLPEMRAGYNGIFFSIYVGQGELTPAGYQHAYDADVAKFDAVHKLAEKMAPDQIEIARTADDVRRIVKSGKAAEAPNVTSELVRRGYTEKQIGQLWSGNLLRVMEQAERTATQLQRGS